MRSMAGSSFLWIPLVGFLLASSCNRGDANADHDGAPDRHGAHEEAVSSEAKEDEAGEDDGLVVCSIGEEVPCGESVEDCVDLSASTQHCGACGRRCFSNQECTDGECTGVGVLSAAELKEALNDKDFKLINVRVPPVGLIPGTDASIPHDRLDLLKDAIGEDRDKRAVLYCGTSTRIRVALQLLREEGYRSISVLEDGFRGWERAGYPVESGAAL